MVNKSRTAWNKGIKMPQMSGKNNPFYGKKHSPEMRKIIKERTKFAMDNMDPIKKQEMISKRSKSNIGISRHKGNVPWNKGLTKENDKRLANIGKINSIKMKEYFKINKAHPLLEARKLVICPKKDSSIEVKMQSFLKQLGIQFFTHQYIKDIEHCYQCDIFIPVQKRISKKTIIECFGTYWHKPYPIGREIDIVRINELRNKGWRVLVFWENEVRAMELKDLKLKMESIN